MAEKAKEHDETPEVDENGFPILAGKTLTELLLLPDLRAGWSVYHYACSPTEGESDYWVDVKEMKDSDILLDTILEVTAYAWLPDTNWWDFLRENVGKQLTA